MLFSLKELFVHDLLDIEEKRQAQQKKALLKLKFFTFVSESLTMGLLVNQCSDIPLSNRRSHWFTS